MEIEILKPSLLTNLHVLKQYFCEQYAWNAQNYLITHCGLSCSSFTRNWSKRLAELLQVCGHCWTDQESNPYLSGGKKNKINTKHWSFEDAHPNVHIAFICNCQVMEAKHLLMFCVHQMRIKTMWEYIVYVYIYIYRILILYIKRMKFLLQQRMDSYILC